MDLINIIPALPSMLYSINVNKKINAVWFSIKGENKKEIKLIISDLHTKRKLFSFSVSDKNAFRKIVNIFSLHLSDKQSYFEYEFGIYKDDFKLS